MSSNGLVRGKLYEYAVVYHPKQTKEQSDRGESPKSVVVTVPTTVMVTGTDSEASMIAARSIPAEYADRLDDMELIVRPF